MPSSLKWIAHEGHVAVPAWVSALRNEVIAAYRRGSMSAERCLKTYFSQGAEEMLPFEAVIYLATRVVIERERMDCVDFAESTLLEGCGEQRPLMEHWIRLGREFFDECDSTVRSA